MEGETRKFDSWAIVEIMGHQRYAGHVTEETIGGCAFVRVDVPAVGDQAAFTKLFGQSSIFCITPVSEEIGRAAAARQQARPIEIYGLLAAPKTDSDFVNIVEDDLDDDDEPEAFGVDYLNG